MRLHALASPDRPLASDRRLAAETNSDGHSRSKANECLGVALSVVPGTDKIEPPWPTKKRGRHRPRLGMICNVGMRNVGGAVGLYCRRQKQGINIYFLG